MIKNHKKLVSYISLHNNPPLAYNPSETKFKYFNQIFILSATNQSKTNLIANFPAGNGFANGLNGPRTFDTNVGTGTLGW